MMADDDANEEKESSILDDFADVVADPPAMRETCDRCRRPATVCWCPYLPSPPIHVDTTVYILQHPFEESRCLRTAPMLYYGLEEGKCHILKGKRFSYRKHKSLRHLVDDPHTLLVYPGPEAEDLQTYVNRARQRGDCGPYNLVLLDGTWPQAGGIYCQNSFLHNLQQIVLRNTGLSEYVIRTQPTEGCLSTAETAVAAIALLEGRPEIREPLIAPLRALCTFQMQHGAVKHQSKQYLIENGLYKKQTPPSESERTQVKEPVPNGEQGAHGRQSPPTGGGAEVMVAPSGDHVEHVPPSSEKLVDMERPPGDYLRIKKSAGRPEVNEAPNHRTKDLTPGEQQMSPKVKDESPREFTECTTRPPASVRPDDVTENGDAIDAKRGPNRDFTDTKKIGSNIDFVNSKCSSEIEQYICKCNLQVDTCSTGEKYEPDLDPAEVDLDAVDCQCGLHTDPSNKKCNSLLS